MTQEHSEAKTQISISEASSLLGVSEATLRQWTDEGRVKAFVTPGGHRRYVRSDLERFLESHQKVLGIKDLVAELEETIPQHRELSRSFLKSAGWFQALDGESQSLVINLGRELHDLSVKYVTDPAHRTVTLTLASDVGRRFGVALAGFGLPLSDSVEAFLLHRGPVVQMVTHLILKKETLSDRVAQTIPMITVVIDKALVSFMLGHQQFREEQNKPEGGPTR